MADKIDQSKSKSTSGASFPQYLQSHQNNDCFTEQYLKAGIDNSSNFGGRLTKKCFFSNFFVHDVVDHNKELVKKLQRFVEGQGRNIILLRATAGSGKSVLVNSLFYENESRARFVDPVYFDFSKSRTDVKEDLFQRVRKKYMSLAGHSNAHLREQLITFRNMANDRVFDIATHSVFNGLAEALNALMPRDNKGMSYTDEELMSSHITTWYKGRSKRAREAVAPLDLWEELLCLYILLIHIVGDSYGDSKSRFTMLFDNVEALAQAATSQISRIIQDTYDTVCHFIDVTEFRSEFKFIIVLRTSTEFSVGYVHNADIFFGGPYDDSIAHFDFTAKALARKLLYLYDNHKYIDRNSKLYRTTYFITRLMIGIDVDKLLLEGNESVDRVEYKTYIENKLAPFFGYNYRNLIMRIAEVLEEDSEVYEKIKELCGVENASDERINGARMILFFHICRRFSRQGIFKAFGIADITKDKTCSTIRQVLMRLDIDEDKKHRLLGDDGEYQGMQLHTLRKHMDFLKIDIESLGHILYTLSAFTDPDEKEHIIRYKMIQAWGHLLEFSSLQYALTGKEATRLLREENEESSRIYIRLSPIGKIYIQYVSKQFELFNARIMRGKYKSLFEEEVRYGLLLTDRMTDIASFADRIIEFVGSKCEPDCILTKGTNGVFSCSLYGAILQISSLVLNCLYYIDRFRVHIVHKYQDDPEGAFRHNQLLIKIMLDYANILMNTSDSLTNLASSGISDGFSRVECIRNSLEALKNAYMNGEIAENRRYSRNKKFSSNDVPPFLETLFYSKHYTMLKDELERKERTPSNRKAIHEGSNYQQLLFFDNP